MSRGIIRDDVTDQEGNAQAAIEVTIYEAGTVALATLYDSQVGGNVVANPLLTNASGVFSAYAEAGEYDISVNSPSGVVVSPDFTCFDADDIAAANEAAERANEAAERAEETINPDDGILSMSEVIAGVHVIEERGLSINPTVDGEVSVDGEWIIL